MTARLGPLLEAFELRTRMVQLSCNNAVGRVEIDARYLIGKGRRPILRASHAEDEVALRR